jgi:aspartate aminotransferase
MKSVSNTADDIVTLSHGHIALPGPLVNHGNGLAIEDRLYGDPAGSRELREAVAAWTTRNARGAVDAGQVVVAPGGRAALVLTLLAACDERPEVAIFAPYWRTYRPLIELSGHCPRVIDPPRKSRDPFEPTAFDSVFGPEVSAVIVNSPRNPDWEVASAAVITTLLERAAASGAILIFDQIYRGLSDDNARAPSPLDVVDSVPEECVIIDGISKAFGLAGLRIGWALVPSRRQAELSAAAASIFASPSSVAQRLATEALSADGLGATERLEIANNRRNAARFLDRLPGVACTDPGAGIFLFPDISARCTDTATLCMILRERHQVSVLSGESFGTPGRLRISVALPGERLNVGLQRIASAIAEIDG